MSNILDDNYMANGDNGHSVLAVSRLKTIGSRSRIVAIIQIVFFSMGFLWLLYAMMIGSNLLANFSNINFDGMESLFFAVIGLFFVFWGLYLFAAIKLMNYGTKITEFTDTGNPETFESAVSDRRVYFMITVIFSIIAFLFNLYATLVSF
jgi:hypothetical protein